MMRLLYAFLVLLVVGCSAGSGPGSGRATSEPDASSDAPTEASRPFDASGIHPTVCCQITVNFVDSSVWNNRLYGCNNSDTPWVCGTEHTAPYTCSDPRCIVGDDCQGENGTGTVVACSPVEGNKWPRKTNLDTKNGRNGRNKTGLNVKRQIKLGPQHWMRTRLKSFESKLPI